MGEALWNGVLHLFVTFWFLWCLISYLMLALTYPQGTDTEVSFGSGDAWAMLERVGEVGRGVGRLVSVGREGTRWHLLAGAEQELHNPRQSEQFRPANTPVNPPFLIWAFLPSSSFISAFSSRCCCCCAAKGARSPECPVITQAQAWHCHVSPRARSNPGFSCLGLRTVRFISSKMFSKESVDHSYSALKMHFKK